MFFLTNLLLWVVVGIMTAVSVKWDFMLDYWAYKVSDLVFVSPSPTSSELWFLLTQTAALTNFVILV